MGSADVGTLASIPENNQILFESFSGSYERLWYLTIDLRKILILEIIGLKCTYSTSRSNSKCFVSCRSGLDELNILCVRGNSDL